MSEHKPKMFPTQHARRSYFKWRNAYLPPYMPTYDQASEIPGPNVQQSQASMGQSMPQQPLGQGVYNVTNLYQYNGQIAPNQSQGQGYPQPLLPKASSTNYTGVPQPSSMQFPQIWNNPAAMPPTPLALVYRPGASRSKRKTPHTLPKKPSIAMSPAKPSDSQIQEASQSSPDISMSFQENTTQTSEHLMLTEKLASIQEKAMQEMRSLIDKSACQPSPSAKINYSSEASSSKSSNLREASTIDGTEKIATSYTQEQQSPATTPDRLPSKSGNDASDHEAPSSKRARIGERDRKPEASSSENLNLGLSSSSDDKDRLFYPPIEDSMLVLTNTPCNDSTRPAALNVSKDHVEEQAFKDDKALNELPQISSATIITGSTKPPNQSSIEQAKPAAQSLNAKLDRLPLKRETNQALSHAKAKILAKQRAIHKQTDSSEFYNFDALEQRGQENTCLGKILEIMSIFESHNVERIHFREENDGQVCELCVEDLCNLAQGEFYNWRLLKAISKAIIVPLHSIVLFAEEKLKSTPPITQNVHTLYMINYVPPLKSSRVGHWQLFRASVIGKEFQIIDSVPCAEIHTTSLEVQRWVMEQAESSILYMERKCTINGFFKKATGPRAWSKFSWTCPKKQEDEFSCGPLTMLHLENCLGLVSNDELEDFTTMQVRLRYATLLLDLMETAHKNGTIYITSEVPDDSTRIVGQRKVATSTEKSSYHSKDEGHPGLAEFPSRKSLSNEHAIEEPAVDDGDLSDDFEFQPISTCLGDSGRDSEPILPAGNRKSGVNKPVELACKKNGGQLPSYNDESATSTKSKDGHSLGFKRKFDPTRDIQFDDSEDSDVESTDINFQQRYNAEYEKNLRDTVKIAVHRPPFKPVTHVVKRGIRQGQKVLEAVFKDSENRIHHQRLMDKYSRFKDLNINEQTTAYMDLVRSQGKRPTIPFNNHTPSIRREHMLLKWADDHKVKKGVSAVLDATRLCRKLPYDYSASEGFDAFTLMKQHTSYTIQYRSPITRRLVLVYLREREHYIVRKLALQGYTSIGSRGKGFSQPYFKPMN